MVVKKQQVDEASGVESKLRGNASDLWQVSEYVERPSRKAPVVYDVDVVVAGAGVAGLIAALAAARYGAKTLLVEPFSSLGGDLGPGLLGPGMQKIAEADKPAKLPGDLEKIPLGGIGEEFDRRGYGDRTWPGWSNPVSSLVSSQAASYTATKMMAEAGVQVLVSTLVSDVIKEGDKVRGVFVENKSGTLAIRSKVVIDCTGTADVADRAGAAVVEQPRNPSMGLWSGVARADWQRHQEAMKTRGELSEDDKQWLAENAPSPAAERLMPWVRQAWEAGDFEFVRFVGGFASLEVKMQAPKGDPSIVGCRTLANGNFQPGDGLALSAIELEMQVYLCDYVRFLNKYVPGFEQAYLLVVSPFFHARGGKSIDPVCRITNEDVANEVRHDDVIYRYYGDKPSNRVPDGCDIPYRMLLPKGIEGLLAAGRSACVRGPQLRVRHRLQLMGQAAGVAAALAVKHGVEPRDIDVKELQRILHELGSNMGPDDRLRELGVINIQ